VKPAAAFVGFQGCLSIKMSGVGAIKVQLSRPLWWTLTAAAAIFGTLLFSRYADPVHARVLIDFYKAYLPSGQAMLTGDYAALIPLYEQHLFVNIPITAWLFAPLAALGSWWAGAVFTVLGALCVFLTIYLSTRDVPLELQLGIVSLFFLNGPLWYSLWMGNTTHMVLFCLIVALILWRRGWLYATGLLFGLVAIIKPALLIFGAYFILKREWRVVLGGATVVLGALAAGIAAYGLSPTTSWYVNIVDRYTSQPVGAYNSQSISNFLLRMRTGAKYLHDWSPHPLSTFGIYVRAMVLAAMGTVALVATLRRTAPGGGQPGSHELTAISLLLIIFMISSTVSWTHYYLLLLLPWALYFTGKMQLPDDWWTRLLVWASILLCSLPVHYNHYPSGLAASLMPRLWDSAWFLGAMLLFFALARAVLLDQARALGWRVAVAEAK
jgi:hypothetical protein